MTKQNDITYKMGVSFKKKKSLWKQEKQDQKHYQHIISDIFIKNILHLYNKSHSLHSLITLPGSTLP